MQAEVISIGDELVSGQRLDTNSQWLSRQLADLGIAVTGHSTIGDDLARNVSALRSAAARADVVVCTGGLGPTLDDLTRQAMAEAFQRPLELDPESLAAIASLFAARGRKMPERNRVQAMFPAGSQVIPNPHGSAPGVDLTVECDGRACRLFALPGVPAEMTQMWHETVVPRIERMAGDKLGRLRHHALRLFGIGESDVEVALPDLIHRERYPTVGITVSRATITLRIAARASGESEFQSLIAPTIEEIHQALGDFVFGEGEQELEDVVRALLAERRKSLASVEVGAASWIGDWMLKASDPTENSFAGSLAFPTLPRAQRWAEADSLSGETLWNKLAATACQRFQSDLALVVGSYPNMKQLAGVNKSFEFQFAIATAEGETRFAQRRMGGHPDVLGPRTAKTGLDLLRRFLLLG